MAKKIFLSEDKKRLEFDEKEYLVKPIDISLEDFNYLIPAYVSVEGILHPYWRSSNNFGKLDTVNNKKADNKKNVNISLDDVLKIDAKTTISQTLSSNQPNAPHSGNRVETVDDNNNTYSVQNSFGFMAYDSIRRKIFTIGTFIGFEHKSYTDPLSYQGIKMISLSEYGHSRITATTVVDNKISGNIEFIFTAPVGVSATIHVPTKSGTLALISDITNSLVNYYTKTETVTNFIGVNNVQTINETKTFSKSPVVPNGTLGSHTVNKNQLDLKVDKNESNEVLQSFDLHQKDGSYISVDVDGLKVSKGGVYTLYKPDSLKPINQVPGAAYQFQELLYPKRAAIGIEEQVYTVTYVNGVKANENGRADIWGVSNNWTNAQQRMSALVSKHNDATYNRLLGMDAQGNIDEVGIYAMTSEMSISTDAQKDAWRLANQKSTETNYSIKPLITMVDIVSIPNGITYPININISGVNLNMVQTVNLVKVRDENGSPIIEESVKIETFTRVSATLITVSLPPNIMTNGWVVFEVTDNFISASRSEMLELTNNVRPITPPIITDWEYIGDATRDKSRDSFNANKVTLLTGTAANAGILNRAKYKANFKITLDMIDKGFEVTIKTTGTNTPVYGQGQIVPSLSIVDSNNNFIYQIDRNISRWNSYNVGELNINGKLYTVVSETGVNTPTAMTILTNSTYTIKFKGGIMSLLAIKNDNTVPHYKSPPIYVPISANVIANGLFICVDLSDRLSGTISAEVTDFKLLEY